MDIATKVVKSSMAKGIMLQHAIEATRLMHQANAQLIAVLQQETTMDQAMICVDSMERDLSSLRMEVSNFVNARIVLKDLT